MDESTAIESDVVPLLNPEDFVGADSVVVAAVARDAQTLVSANAPWSGKDWNSNWSNRGPHR